jgi:hypothetical protein
MEILGCLNSEPPDYESGVPITETQHSVLSVVMRTKILLSFKFNQLVHHHHHSEHGQGLGLRTCSFEAQGVPGPSILLSVFPAVPEVGTGRPASVGGFYPFVPGGLPISFDTL